MSDKTFCLNKLRCNISSEANEKVLNLQLLCVFSCFFPLLSALSVI